MKNERNLWFAVIRTIIFVIKFLEEKKFKFSSKRNKLYEQNNGHFFKCIEMLEKFDPFISEHTRRITIDSEAKKIPLIKETKFKMKS